MIHLKKIILVIEQSVEILCFYSVDSIVMR